MAIVLAAMAIEAAEAFGLAGEGVEVGTAIARGAAAIAGTASGAIATTVGVATAVNSASNPPPTDSANPKKRRAPGMWFAAFKCFCASYRAEN